MGRDEEEDDRPRRGKKSLWSSSVVLLLFLFIFGLVIGAIVENMYIEPILSPEKVLELQKCQSDKVLLNQENQTCLAQLYGGSATSNVSDRIVDSNKVQGIVLQKFWAMSAESYCAQGSDYFVLQTSADGNQVLKYDEKLLPFAGKSVEIEANLLERIIKCPANSQCLENSPGTDGYKCTLLEATKISEITN